MHNYVTLRGDLFWLYLCFVLHFQSRLGGLKFSIGFTPKDKSKENAKSSSKVGNLVKMFELRGSKSSQTESKSRQKISTPVKTPLSDSVKSIDSNSHTSVKHKDSVFTTPVKQNKNTPLKGKGTYSKFYTPIKSKLKIPNDPIKLAVTPVKALGNLMQKIPTPRRSHRVTPLKINEKD